MGDKPRLKQSPNSTFRMLLTLDPVVGQEGFVPLGMTYFDIRRFPPFLVGLPLIFLGGENLTPNPRGLFNLAMGRRWFFRSFCRIILSVFSH